MRKFLIAILLLSLFVTSTSAQDACGSALPPRLETGEQGLVDVADGFFLNLRVNPGAEGEEMLRLAKGEIFDVVEGPQCVDGSYWWRVQQFDLSGWIAESAGNDYLVQPFDQSALPTLPPLPTPSEGLAISPVLLADNPQTLETEFITWDWEGFLERIGSFYTPPDPLSVTLPETYQGTNLPAGPFDLSAVRFVEDANLNDAQRTLLAQNGFVVVPGERVQFESAYQWDESWSPNTGHGYWVSTDALLHSLYVAFDNLLQFLETEELHSQLLSILTETYTAAESQWQMAQETDLEPAARAAATYYAVALGLLDDGTYQAQVSEDIRAEADPLIEAALNAEGRLDVPFLPDYQEDFSQYQPRGHYTASAEQERYFRAMMWLGRITFLTRDTSSLQSSLFGLRALVESDSYAQWQSLSELLTFLVGPTDNLGPVEYLPLAREIFGEALPVESFADNERLDAFQEALFALPGPRINNVVRPIGTGVSELDETTRGFRLFGQRFTFDGYAMQRLIYPEVGTVGNERTLPSGLDVAAVMGSEAAYRLLEAQGETEYTNYTDNLIELRSDASAMNPPDWFQNAYGGWLWALQPLWARPAEPYPSLMNTEAWLRRDLQAGLASWAELKHATLLYTAQPTGGLGGGGERIADTYGLVEPNPLVFSRVAVVSTAIADALNERGLAGYDFSSGPPSGSSVLRDAFRNVAELSAMLTDMARKELWGEPLTEDEQLFLKYDFGSKLWYTRYLAELPLADPPEMAAIIADVASNPDAGTVLEVGTGLVDFIYVITDSPQGLQLTRGTVYSYYEFTQPIDERLDDDTWRERVAAGDVPARPAWISAFYAE